MIHQGSCNDILELEIKPNQPRIGLQRGPKSYSYGPFVKALELCRDTDASRGDTGRQHAEEENMEDQEEGDGGLDAFLDACDNEQFEDEEDDEDNEDDDFDDYLYNPSNNSSNDMKVSSSSTQSSISSDIHAIDALTETLQSVRAGLERNPLVDQGKNGNANEKLSPEDQYCSILIRSEIQTVDFYLAIACELRRRLARHTKEGGKTPHDTKYDKEQSNHDHINSVCDAFLSIRYSHLK